MVRIIAGILALLIGSLSYAQTIYQSTDKRGNPVFTDQPQSTAKPVELKPINTTPSITPNTQNQSEPAPAFAGYKSLQLAVPSSIPNGLAPTTIGIVIQPQLQPGHRWELMLDGQQQAEGQAGSVTIDQMERGQHQLLLQIVDQNGNSVASSKPVDVFVFWPSKNR
jgi:uncharacterized protein DUF4124